MPGVVEPGAFGVTDMGSGVLVKIVSGSKDPTLTAEALRAHCRQHLSGCKLPGVGGSRPQPKTRIGKIVKRQGPDTAAAAGAGAAPLRPQE